MSRMLYVLARRSISPETRDRVKGWLARRRRSLAPIMKAMHGTFDANDLFQELTRRLPRDFEVLMVHCALDDLAPMYRDGPLELLRMLQKLCGPHRTLAMPAFSYLVPGGDLVRHLETHPRFEVHRSPSQMGLLSEMFRRTPGVVRSYHPTHSVCAIGPLASSLTSEHHLGTSTFGEKSPFAKMAEFDTIVLGPRQALLPCPDADPRPGRFLGDRFPVAREFRSVEVTMSDGKSEHQDPMPNRFSRRQTGAWTGCRRCFTRTISSLGGITASTSSGRTRVG